MRSAWTRASRSLRFGRDVTLIYAGYKWTQRRSRDLTAEAREQAYEREHTRAAKRLYRLAVDLKGLNIKTGQFIGTRADLAPPAYVEWLGKLQDHVPPRPFGLVRRIVEQELGEPLGQLFSSFEREPLGAASLAQVHRATLPDGREVAVKVQYPEVERLVRIDLANTTCVVNLLARTEPNFDYRSVLAELSVEVPRELDFVREGRMLRRVSANLARLDGIVLPEVIDGYNTRRVLVTTYLHGVNVRDIEAIRAMGVEPERVAWLLAAAYGHQILGDGVFQADPHPGNILVLPDGRVGLIDFGLVKELPSEVRAGVADLVIAAAEQDPVRILAAFERLGVRTKHDEHSSILSLVRLMFDERPLFGSHIAKQADQALRYNPVNAIPSDIVLFGRVIGLLRGVSASLNVSFTPMQMLLPYAAALRDGRPPPTAVGPLASGDGVSDVAG